MGRMPVLKMAGAFLTSLALAGCQSSSSARPSTQFTPPSGSTVGQNKTVTTTTGGGTVTYNGQPGSQGTSAVQLNGGFSQTSTTGQSSLPGQPSSQVVPAGQTSRVTSTTNGNFVVPANPTPAPGQLPTSGMQPLPSVSSSLNASAGVQMPNSSVSSNSSLMPSGSPTINMIPPPPGAMGPAASPLSVSGGVSLNTFDSPGPPTRSMNTTSYPVPSPNPAGIGGTQGPMLQN
jgi:hypothetical protein